MIKAGVCYVRVRSSLPPAVPGFGVGPAVDTQGPDALRVVRGSSLYLREDAARVLCYAISGLLTCGK